MLLANKETAILLKGIRIDLLRLLLGQILPNNPLDYLSLLRFVLDKRFFRRLVNSWN